MQKEVVNLYNMLQSTLVRELLVLDVRHFELIYVRCLARERQR